MLMVMMMMMMAVIREITVIFWGKGKRRGKFGIRGERRGGSPAVAAGEDVFDALICAELARLGAPGGGEGAAVDVLELGGFAGAGHGGHAFLYPVSGWGEKGMEEGGVVREMGKG
jgi:hypothetical protein